MLDSIYQMTLKLLSNYDFGMKMLILYHYIATLFWLHNITLLNLFMALYHSQTRQHVINGDVNNT